MASIYLHIPFCHKACTYCDFHFSVSRANQGKLIDAMVREIELRSAYLETDVLDSIYLGGGTPSLLTLAQLQQLFDTIQAHFKVKADAEITLEANPDDIHLENLNGWKALGINRLSVGIQSFNEIELQWMNRSHSIHQAEQALSLIQKEGWQNFTIDLMYGLPNSSEADWKYSLEKALEFQPPHISAYCLTVEAKTLLQKQILTHAIEAPSEDRAHQDFDLLQQTLIAAGYLQYEISNFAKPGFEAKHNGAYWAGSSYLGIGPSAHSFNGKSRQWNVSSNARYIQLITEQRPYFETEELSIRDRYNELIMTGLRTTKGVSLIDFGCQVGHSLVELLLEEANPLINEGILEHRDQYLKLKPTALFQADTHIARLFWVD